MAKIHPQRIFPKTIKNVDAIRVGVADPENMFELIGGAVKTLREKNPVLLFSGPMDIRTLRALMQHKWPLNDGTGRYIILMLIYKCFPTSKKIQSFVCLPRDKHSQGRLNQLMWKKLIHDSWSNEMHHMFDQDTAVFFFNKHGVPTEEQLDNAIL